MKKNNLNLYIKIFFALLFAIVAVTFFQNTPSQISSINQETQSTTVLIDKTTINLQSTPNTTFYDALMQAKNAGKITFSGKNYAGLGFFVTDIGSLHSGNGKDLLYYVNGKEAQVGVSSYVLKNGDIIEWKLE
jgi:hypothetical protein